MQQRLSAGYKYEVSSHDAVVACGIPVCAAESVIFAWCIVAFVWLYSVCHGVCMQSVVRVNFYTHK